MKSALFAILVVCLGCPAMAQDGGATSTLSPPPGEENSAAITRCNKAADAQEIRGVSRDPWIADCLKKERNESSARAVR